MSGLTRRTVRRFFDALVLSLALGTVAAAQPSQQGAPVVHRGVELYRIYDSYGLLSGR